MPSPNHTVLIATWLEADQVDRIRSLDPSIAVWHEPDLIPPPRYPADHTGAPFERSPAAERTWREMLAEADIHFDFDRTNLSDLPDLATSARWIQGTSAGLGGLLTRHDLVTRMPDTQFTTAAGIHAQPLAEFCLFALLWFVKRADKMVRDQRDHRWDRFAARELAGRTVLIVGVGGIGKRVASLLRGLGVRVIGIKRTVSGVDPRSLEVESLHTPDALPDLLPEADALVIAAPGTPQTAGMIGARELALMRRGAVLVNIGRGELLDEDALVEALRSGALAGAALDVFRTEPLPAASPLWDLPNTLICPHSAATSVHENARLTDLFCDNLRRYLAGKPLRNLYDARRGY